MCRQIVRGDTRQKRTLREIRLVVDDQVRPAESQLVAAAGPETDNVLNHVPVVHV